MRKLEVSMSKAGKEINKILDILDETYPDAKCELHYTTPFELLIATVLSAQTTDKKVNEVTKTLFAKYSSPEDYLKADQLELEHCIREIGLYRNKTKNIKKLSKVLVNEYNGEIPDSKEKLMKLAGVGRKTANVVLSNAFNVPAIAVDTHVFRVSNRIGIANAENVLKTEEQLQNAIPKERWSKAHHYLIFHGRRICKARKPNCEECPLAGYCDYYIDSR